MQVPIHSYQIIDPPFEPQHVTNYLQYHKCLKLNKTMFYLQRGLGIKEIELQRKRLTKKGAPMCNFNPCVLPRNKTPPKTSKMLPNTPNPPLPQRSPTKCLNAIQHSRKTHEWAHNLLKVIQNCTRHTHKHKECVERDDYYSRASLFKRCTLGGVHDNPYGITLH